jgi:hypothetical protein
LDSGADAPDSESNNDDGDYWDKLVAPVNDVVRLTTLMIPPPAPGEDEARVAMFNRAFPRGMGLEAMSDEGRTYRLCHRDSLSRYHYQPLYRGDDSAGTSAAKEYEGEEDAYYELRGQRVAGASWCVHATLRPMHESDRPPGAACRRGSLNSSACVRSATYSSSNSMTDENFDERPLRNRTRRVIQGAASLGTRPALILRLVYKGLTGAYTPHSTLLDWAQAIPPFIQRVSSGRAVMPVTYNSNCFYETSITKDEADAWKKGFGELIEDSRLVAASHPDPACRISEAQWWGYYKHIIMAIPSSNLPFPAIAGNPGYGVGANGGVPTEAILHEIGHNLGLPHAMTANTAVKRYATDYGNAYDIMGAPYYESRSFLAGYQDVIGWMGPNNKVSYPNYAYDDELSSKLAGASELAWTASHSLADDRGRERRQHARDSAHSDSASYLRPLQQLGLHELVRTRHGPPTPRGVPHRGGL